LKEQRRDKRRRHQMNSRAGMLQRRNYFTGTSEHRSKPRNYVACSGRRSPSRPSVDGTFPVFHTTGPCRFGAMRRFPKARAKLVTSEMALRANIFFSTRSAQNALEYFSAACSPGKKRGRNRRFAPGRWIAPPGDGPISNTRRYQLQGPSVGPFFNLKTIRRT
jgi:hypothetical protein